jgi:hypothetical protein
VCGVCVCARVWVGLMTVGAGAGGQREPAAQAGGTQAVAPPNCLCDWNFPL